MNNDIRELRDIYLVDRDILMATVRNYCPGEHKATQHRDHKPPWCNLCGYTDDGILIRESKS